MLDLKQLFYFVAAYEEKSVTAAAKRCFISQPSITHAIKSLESNLNCVLFERSKTGLQATHHAHLLYKEAILLLKKSDAIVSAFKKQEVISANIYFQGDISLEPLRGFIEEAKHHSRIVLNWVSHLQQADIAIVEKEQVGKRFNFTPLLYEGFSLILPVRHPLAHKASLKIADLNGLNFIERPYCSMRVQFQALLAEQHVELQIGAIADNDLQALDLVSLGFGVAAIPRHRSIGLPPQLTCKEVDTHFERTIGIAIRNSQRHIHALLKEAINRWRI